MWIVFGIIAVALLVTFVGLAIVMSLVVFGFISIGRGVRALIGTARRMLMRAAERTQLPPTTSPAPDPAPRSQGATAPTAGHPADAPAPPVHLDPDVATSGQVASAVRTMEHDPTLGRYAESILSSLERADFYEVTFEQMLDQEFGKGGITWARFHAPVVEALGEIVATDARMANRMRMFDSAWYRQTASAGAPLGSAEAERMEVMGQTLVDLERMEDAVLRTIVGLERLYAEVSSISVSHTEEDATELLDDLRRLSEDAKMYS